MGQQDRNGGGGSERGMDRRSFLGGVAALGVASGIAAHMGTVEAAAWSAKRKSGAAGKGGKLPARGEFVIRNAYVMTMDAALGDIARGDVHVRNGEILAIGTDLKAPGVAILDGRGMIVLPGLVETHWHMWNTLLRSMSGDKREHGYFPTAAALGKVFMPEDMYQGTRLAATEAIHGGITSVHDWCHNIRSPQFAEENLRALSESGIRARFSYGSPQGHPANATIDLADLERLHRDWKRYSHEGLLTLGLAWRGAYDDPKAMIPNEAARREFDTARRLGMPISIHVSNSHSRAGQIAVLAKENLLGKDVQLIHAIWVTPEELRSVAAAGSGVSFSPYTEMRIGFGFPHAGEFIAANIPIGLSIDTITLSGNADMFAIMKAIQNIENGRSENEFKLLPRRVLEMATIEGARTMGIDDRVGSLRPGKRADVIMVSSRDVNMGPFTDPAHLLVEAAQPANVDTVVVDGRILKRHGKLTAIDTRRMMDEATISLTGVRKRAGWW